MDDPRNDLDGLPLPAEVVDTTEAAPEESVERLLDESRAEVHFRLVTRVYGIPESDADRLLEEVWSHCVGNPPDVENPRTWLTLTVCNAARAWLRERGLEEPKEDEVARQRHSMFTRKALATLTDSARTAVRMWSERRSYEEIAAELNVTTLYAQHLVINTVLKLTALTRGR